MVRAPNNIYTAKEKYMTRYGYIGLGAMGSAMAENLIRNSSDVIVYDFCNQSGKAHPWTSSGVQMIAHLN